tara:strand:+ start:227 stop:577 length:351 start_codon:yes stop_codon:yes gene_type:complete
MKAIFKISHYYPETNQITIRFCRLHAPKNIDEYRPISLDLGEELDLYDIETFTQSIMRKAGEKWIERHEDSEELLFENIPETPKGKFNMEDLVGKVISCETYKRYREGIKMRKVEL